MGSMSLLGQDLGKWRAFSTTFGLIQVHIFRSKMFFIMPLKYRSWKFENLVSFTLGLHYCVGEELCGEACMLIAFPKRNFANTTI